MFVKGLSTRHTDMGTFRFGVVYEIDEKDHKIKKHVLPLLDGKSPALARLTKEQAQKEAGNPVQLTPALSVPDAAKDNATLRDAVKKAQAGQKAAEELAATEEERAKTAASELLKVVAERDKLSADLGEERDLRTAAQQEVETLKASATASSAAVGEKIATLEAELQKAVEDRDAARADAKAKGEKLTASQKELKTLKAKSEGGEEGQK